MTTRRDPSIVPSRAFFFGAALLAAGAAPLFAGACGGDEPTSSSGGPVAIESIRDEFAAAECAYRVNCGRMPDAATCRAVVNSDQELLQLIADVVYGTVEYDGAAARKCVDAIKSQSCDALPSKEKALVDACEGVFKGSVPEGGECVTDQECVGKGACDKSMAMGGEPCRIGVCVAEVPPVPLGGDCSMAGCVVEAYCDQSGAGGMGPTCESRKNNGDPCEQKDACLEGQRCDTNGDHTCYKLSAEGQQCNPTIATGACQRFDNWCDTTEKKCVKLPGDGEPCADVNGELKCLSYAYCDMAGMTCKRRPSQGEACMQGGPECLGSLQCWHDDMTMTDTCVLPPSGAVCVLDVKKP